MTTKEKQKFKTFLKEQIEETYKQVKAGKIKDKKNWVVRFCKGGDEYIIMNGGVVKAYDEVEAISEVLKQKDFLYDEVQLEQRGDFVTVQEQEDFGSLLEDYEIIEF